LSKSMVGIRQNLSAGGKSRTRFPSALTILSMKKPLITGVTGQDGSYLAEFLLNKGYLVHGLQRRAPSLKTERVAHIYEDFHDSDARFFLHYADLTDGPSLTRLLVDISPDEIYNLGAMSHVKVSFDVPE